MTPVTGPERDSFLQMAIRHFSELNRAFIPRDDWKQHYFESIRATPDVFLRWIISEGERVGFILFGLERRGFVPSKTGFIYELFVAPEFRRRGIARHCAAEAIKELSAFGAFRIQLEVAEGNRPAAEFWETLGFSRVAARYSMDTGHK
jgi:ribosomal protein S18 acetylase RimI-like enzyme